MDKLPLAVLIDGENVAATRMPAIMAYARRLGEPQKRCVIGDFEGNHLSGWAEIAPKYAFDTISQRSGGKGKNSADIALTICAMDLLAEQRFCLFLIVSSDRDFAPLAMRLGQSGVSVYGMGEEESGIRWKAACKEFQKFAKEESAAMKTPAPTKPFWSVEDRAEVLTLLRRFAPADGQWIKLSQLGQHVQKRSKALHTRLANGRLRKNLAADPVVDVRGKGPGLEVRLKQRQSTKQTAAPPTAPRPLPSEVHLPA